MEFYMTVICKEPSASFSNETSIENFLSSLKHQLIISLTLKTLLCLYSNNCLDQGKKIQWLPRTKGVIPGYNDKGCSLISCHVSCDTLSNYPINVTACEIGSNRFPLISPGGCLL